MSAFFTLVSLVSFVATVGAIIFAFVLAARNGNAGTHASNKALKFVCLLLAFLVGLSIFVPIFMVASMSLSADSSVWPFVIGMTVVGLGAKWLVEKFGRVLYGWFKGDPAYW